MTVGDIDNIYDSAYPLELGILNTSNDDKAINGVANRARAKIGCICPMSCKKAHPAGKLQTGPNKENTDYCDFYRWGNCLGTDGAGAGNNPWPEGQTCTDDDNGILAGTGIDCKGVYDWMLSQPGLEGCTTVLNDRFTDLAPGTTLAMQCPQTCGICDLTSPEAVAERDNYKDFVDQYSPVTCALEDNNALAQAIFRNTDYNYCSGWDTIGEFDDGAHDFQIGGKTTSIVGSVCEEVIPQFASACTPMPTIYKQTSLKQRDTLTNLCLASGATLSTTHDEGYAMINLDAEQCRAIRAPVACSTDNAQAICELSADKLSCTNVSEVQGSDADTLCTLGYDVTGQCEFNNSCDVLVDTIASMDVADGTPAEKKLRACDKTTDLADRGGMTDMKPNDLQKITSNANVGIFGVGSAVSVDPVPGTALKHRATAGIPISCICPKACYNLSGGLKTTEEYCNVDNYTQEGGTCEEKLGGNTLTALDQTKFRLWTGTGQTVRSSQDQYLGTPGAAGQPAYLDPMNDQHGPQVPFFVVNDSAATSNLKGVMKVPASKPRQSMLINRAAQVRAEVTGPGPLPPRGGGH